MLCHKTDHPTLVSGEEGLDIAPVTNHTLHAGFAQHQGFLGAKAVESVVDTVAVPGVLTGCYGNTVVFVNDHAGNGISIPDSKNQLSHSLRTGV